MNGFRERMARFMYGRYGNDQLSKVYLGLALAFLVLNLITGKMLFYVAGTEFTVPFRKISQRCRRRTRNI